MLHLLPLVALAASPFTLSVSDIRSEVEALPTERVATMMTNALTAAAARAQVDLVPTQGEVIVTGKFSANQSQYRLWFGLRSRAHAKQLAFDFKTTKLGEAGAAKMAEAILKEAGVLIEADRQAATAAPAATAQAREPAEAPFGTESPSNGSPSSSNSSWEDGSSSRSLSKKSEPASPNSIYAEAAGAGAVYSVNYERLLFDVLGLRLGFEYFPVGASNGSSSGAVHTFGIPFGVSYLGLRSGKHAFEMGLGGTIFISSTTLTSQGMTQSVTGVIPAGWVNAGYRFHPINNLPGFNFRLGVMAVVGHLLGVEYLIGAPLGTDLAGPYILPWGYISFGASF